MAARSALLLCGLPAAHATLADGLDGGMIPTDHIAVPDRPLAGVVAPMSDSAGWGAAGDALAASLQVAGIGVIGIDVPAYDAALDAAPGNCVYLISDIERLSHQIQRASGGASYHAPILAGAGAAGSLAPDLVDQPPAATVGGTVVTDPSVGVTLRKPLCTSAHHRASASGTVYALPSGTPADRVSIGLTAGVAQAVRDRVDDFKAQAANVAVLEGRRPRHRRPGRPDPRDGRQHRGRARQPADR